MPESDRLSWLIEFIDAPVEILPSSTKQLFQDASPEDELLLMKCMVMKYYNREGRLAFQLAYFLKEKMLPEQQFDNE